MFGCYRKADANDPDIYVAAITAILAEYEPEIIRIVTDPREGIARKSKWMPSISELDEECIAAQKRLKSQEYMRLHGFIWRNNKWEKAA